MHALGTLISKAMSAAAISHFRPRHAIQIKPADRINVAAPITGNSSAAFGWKKTRLEPDRAGSATFLTNPTGNRPTERAAGRSQPNGNQRQPPTIIAANAILDFRRSFTICTKSQMTNAAAIVPKTAETDMGALISLLTAERMRKHDWLEPSQRFDITPTDGVAIPRMKFQGMMKDQRLSPDAQCGFPIGHIQETIIQ